VCLTLSDGARLDPRVDAGDGLHAVHVLNQRREILERIGVVGEHVLEGVVGDDVSQSGLAADEVVTVAEVLGEVAEPKRSVRRPEEKVRKF